MPQPTVIHPVLNQHLKIALKSVVERIMGGKFEFVMVSGEANVIPIITEGLLTYFVFSLTNW